MLCVHCLCVCFFLSLWCVGGGTDFVDVLCNSAWYSMYPHPTTSPVSVCVYSIGAPCKAPKKIAMLRNSYYDMSASENRRTQIGTALFRGSPCKLPGGYPKRAVPCLSKIVKRYFGTMPICSTCGVGPVGPSSALQKALYGGDWEGPTACAVNCHQ